MDDWLDDVAAPVRRGGRPLKDGRGRQRKILCPSCGFIGRASAGALERAGMPTCGCGELMIVPEPRDRAKVEPDAMLEEVGAILARSGRAAARDYCRTAGWTREETSGALDYLDPQNHESRAGTSRCQWAGGYCMIYTAGRYCAEHDPEATR